MMPTVSLFRLSGLLWRGLYRMLYVAVALASVPSVVHAVGETTNGFPNWEERVIHAWINRAQRSAIRDERLHRRQLRGESLLHGDGAAELQPGTESRGAFSF